MQKTQKHSRQRDALLTLLKSVKNHPTADWLYDELKKEFPRISLATVYRNLNLLEKNQQILRLECNDDREHFDGNSQRHYHFICRNCSAIIDISVEMESPLDKLVKEKDSLTIEDHALFFYGLCDKCR